MSEEVNPPNPAPEPAPTPAPAPAAESPPATRIVVEGKRSEREIELERQLERERTAKQAAEDRAKSAETDAAYQADEARQYKEALAAAPKPRRAVKKQGIGWFEYEEEE